MPSLIMLVEDNPADAERIHRLLRRLPEQPFQARHVQTLAEAVSQVDPEIELILLDLTLPDSSGIESVDRMLTQAPQLPLIVLTGMDDDRLATEAVQRGAEDYLVKQRITAEALVRAVHYAIERKRAKLALQEANEKLERRVEERTKQLIEAQRAARRHLEELAHADRLNSLGELASGLAHELNQPLMAIAAFSHGIKQRLPRWGEELDEIREMVDDITSEAVRAGEIIKRLRLMVRKREPQRARIHINNVVRSTYDLLSQQINHHGIQCRLELAEFLPVLSADRIQIQQVLINLITNAIQAMEGSPEAERRLDLGTAYNRADATVQVDVCNTGPILTNEQLELLFQPFYTTKADGLGLGLSISRSIIDSHEGELIILPGETSGATFRFTLPVSAPPQTL